MIKLIHINLTPQEYIPLEPLITALPFVSMTKDVSLRITSYLSAIAMLKHGILPEDMNKPKELTNLRIEFDLRKRKFTYKATMAITIPSEDKESSSFREQLDSDFTAFKDDKNDLSREV